MYEMNEQDLILRYNRLLNDYKKALRINQNLSKEIDLLKEQKTILNKKIKDLNNDLANSSNFAIDQLTLTQFKNIYLTQQYSFNDMPDKSGIYAYFNDTTNQLYIGQSVNMGNRLRQHFRRGSLRINGHDSEFTDENQWNFYVLEYIERSNKKKLDDREAFWIALGKLAISDKTIYNYDGVNNFAESLLNPKVKSSNIQTSKTVKGSGNLTNRTRGNNVRM